MLELTENPVTLNGGGSDRSGTLTITVDTSQNYLPPIVKFDKVLYAFSNDGQQNLTLEIKTNAPPIENKPRFHFAFIRAKGTHSTWIEQLLRIDPNKPGSYIPHGEFGEDLPDDTQVFQIRMKMHGKMSIYFRVFVHDRLTGAYIDCDPQASNDPDPSTGNGI